MARPRRDASKAGQSALAAAQQLRGRDPDNRIGSEVVNRIVSNSTQEFQNYLATAAGQNAMANVAPMAPPPPQYVEPVAPPLPPPMLGGGVALDSAFGTANMTDFFQSPFRRPVGATMPPVAAPSPINVMPDMPPPPTPPMLGIPEGSGMDPAMERLLRYFGLI